MEFTPEKTELRLAVVWLPGKKSWEESNLFQLFRMEQALKSEGRKMG